jgi:flavin reductase (DIM6/NTAB) family NADH-FMN oxidoreductase RutF
MREVIKKIALGETSLPQEFTLGLAEPQTEIAVWLHGAGKPIDVTYRQAMVCAAPLTICIGFDSGQRPSGKDITCLSLKFCERSGQGRVLGEIGLEFKAAVSVAGSELVLFEPRSSKNYCLPRARLAAHYLFHAYQHWRKDNTKGVKMSFLERRASMVIFISPHPILLVSVGSRENGNIFPMNLLGDLGNGYFGFALRTERVVGGLVERAGHLALSSLPLSHGALAYQLAHNHARQSFDWDQLPFPTMLSTTFHIPFPAFALRVRELKIETVRALGSHSLLIGRIIHDEKLSDGLGFCSIHGFYQFWRLKGRGEDELEAALAVDAHSKWGRFHPLPEQNEPMKMASQYDKAER